MSQLLIEVDTPENENLLLQLLPKLGSRVVDREASNPESGQSPVDVLKRIAARGGASSFGDASEWQRETREDRVLPGRDE